MHCQVIEGELPDWDDRSVISVDPPSAGAAGPSAEEEPPEPERPAREPKKAFAAMHPERDTEEAPLTNNERRQLRKLSQQMTSFRLWLTEQERNMLKLRETFPRAHTVSAWSSNP
jgi:hypothetical protein